MRDWGDKVVFFPGEPLRGAARAGQILRSAIRTRPIHFYHKGVRHLYRRYRPRSFPFPQWVHVEVTNACDMDCVMCPRRDMERPVGFMDQELFDRLIGQLRPMRRFIEGVALMGLGEPLLHRRLVEMSVQAKRAGLSHVYTSTNAQLLDGEAADLILARSGFDRIIFSVDGADRETYESIRLKGDYDRVVANIEGFLERKRRTKRTRPRTTLQMLVMEQTEHEVDEFLARWVPKLGPTDDILIKTVDTFGGQVADYRADLFHRPAERIPCRQLWKDLSIAWDGAVTVCCKDVLYRLAVGDARKDRLVDIWTSAGWNAIRRAHLGGRWTMPPCDVCDEWYL